MGYTKDAAKGLGWMGGFRVLNRLIVFGKTALLARLLTPSQFGVFGIANLLLVFLEVFTETGVNTILIQEKKKLEEYIDTAWIVSIARGLLMACVMLLSAPFIARFFGSSESMGVIQMMSLIPLVRGFLNPSLVKLQKDLEFGKEFWIRTAILTSDTLVAVVMSLIYRNVYGLVWGMLVGVFVELVLSWVIIKPRPVLIFDKIKFINIVGRGKWVTLSGIFHYLFQNGDNIVVGRLLGDIQLGIYSVAYKISSLPISEIADVFIKVTFPVYVKISEDKKRLRNAFLKSTALSSIMVIFVGLIVYFFSEQIVMILLGNQWKEAIPIVRMLAIFGMLRGILIPSHSLFLSVGKQSYVTIVTLIGILGLAFGIVPLTTKYGLMGTAYSVIVATLITLPVVIYLVIKILGDKKQTN